MKSKVLTLSQTDFEKECHRLEKAVTDFGFCPDAVLAIATGGVYVGGAVFPSLPHFSILVQRPSTHRKSGLGKVLSWLPRRVRDLLRIAEARMLSLRKPAVRSVDDTVPDMGHAGAILIVDDAVDSGSTLASVCEAVANRYPEARIVSAVITVTTSHPLRDADVALYRNHTLIRFPWSLDA